MTTLFDISGIQARIFHLQGRPPFMIAADLAEVYGTSVKRIGESVKRNQDLFPDDFAFRLTGAETDHLKSQNVTSAGALRSQFATAKTISTMTRFDPLAFTHAGANGLSAVLKTPTARKMHVTVHRAFAAMEAQAIADARFMIQKLHSDVLVKKPIYGRVKLAADNGWSLDRLWRETSYPRHRVEAAARELAAMGVINGPLVGMQPGLFDA